jgi:hypothetical protein
MEKENEIWKDVPNYEGYYQVSDLGRVKSLSRLARNKRGCWFSKERMLNPTIGTTGYFYVKLNKETKRKNIKVHQLVAMSFLGHKLDGTQKVVVDHINNIKIDNNLSNLQIITGRLNISKDRKKINKCLTGVEKINNERFRAKIVYNGKSIHLGIFKTEKEASEYYQNAVKSIENGEEIKHNKKEKSSIYKGVSYCKRDKKWIAFFFLNGKTNHLGTFKTELEAFESRCKYVESLNN